MQNLSHVNIPKLYGIYETQNEIYLELELCRGNSLDSIIERKQKFNEKDARFIMIELLNTLAYFHSLGIIHRDINPMNIIILYFITKVCYYY